MPDRGRAGVLASVNVDRMRELQDDPTLLDLSDVQALLAGDMHHRAVVLDFARTTYNYTDGGHLAWPPAGDVLRRKLPPDGSVAGVRDWPPDVQLLPPPTTVAGGRPRWRAGVVYQYAMQSGRMDPDGNVVAVSGRGPTRKPRLAQRPDLAEIDPTEIARLTASEEVVTLAGVASLFNVTSDLARQWRNRMNYLRHAPGAVWPPPAGVEQRDTRAGRRPPVEDWPPHPSILPAPAHRAATHWLLGSLRAWGMQVGRISPAGDVLR